MWQLFYYKMPQKLLQNVAVFLLQHTTDFLQNATIITKCSDFITKCGSFYKMLGLVLNPSVHTCSLFQQCLV